MPQYDLAFSELKIQTRFDKAGEEFGKGLNELEKLS